MGDTMSFMSHLRLALHMPSSPSQTKEAGEAREGAVRRVVRRVARGNIRLQRGEYDTKADVEAQYERIKDVEFDDH